MARRIRTRRPSRTKQQDQLLELSPHRYEFVPAWAATKGSAR